MKTNSLINDRVNLVVKSNELIQKTRYELTLQEQKIILFVISKIKPTDEDLKEYSIPLQDLCEICGVECLGENYRHFKSSIYALGKKDFEIRDGKLEGSVRWLEMPTFNIETKTLNIRINPLLKPYLLALRKNFTQYELGCVLAMKSKYSIRMYELLKSYTENEEIIFYLDELKEMLQTPEYTEYKNFRVRVIEKAIAEINKYTDLEVSFEPLRHSRVITRLRFIITRKSSIEQVAVRARRNAALDAK